MAVPSNPHRLCFPTLQEVQDFKLKEKQLAEERAKRVSAVQCCAVSLRLRSSAAPTPSIVRRSTMKGHGNFLSCKANQEGLVTISFLLLAFIFAGTGMWTRAS